ncbi:MAG: replicative DNA helicase [Bacteroidetes bacterium 4572_77]|nr:MAG: replicative DNA helicase [Bacteroidetes bacterium 4572_77]
MENTNKQSNNTNIKKKNNVPGPFDMGKIPPQAVDLEEAVLGALLLERDALTSVIDILKSDIFYKESHQKIYSAIAELFAASEPVDILTVTDKLKKNGHLEEIGGPYYITQLTNRIGTPANIEFHTRILAQKYILRELIHVSSATIKEAFEDGTDVFNLLDKAEQGLFDISENNFRRESLDMRSLVKDAIDEVEKAKNSEGTLRGVPSGFTGLDRLTAGWQKSDLVVIAARPGMGKTAFALSLTRNAAISGAPVAIFSLEMSSVQLATRLISSETEISGEKLKKGDLREDEWKQLNTRVKALEDAPIYIDDTPSLSVFELRAKCRRLKEQHGIELIVVDYIQLMRAGENTGNREQEISTISRSLKALAKELNVPVLVLSQLNRSVETRGGDKKPMLSDLRESGAIEQDADMVIFIYRPEYYDIIEGEGGVDLRGKGEIIIAKHRNGSLDSVFLRFIGQYIKFADLENNEFLSNADMSPNEAFDTSGNKRVLSRMNDLPDEQGYEANNNPNINDTPF